MKAECSASERTISYLSPLGSAGKTARRDSTDTPSSRTSSRVPVMSIHGMVTLPNALLALPSRGALGLKRMAALIRGSVNDWVFPKNSCPLTACVVTAPNECPDMPIFSRFNRSCKACFSV